MERFCGALLRVIKSRRYPYSNVDNHVVADTQLSQIKLLYDLDEKLSLVLPRLTKLLVLFPSFLYVLVYFMQSIY